MAAKLQIHLTPDGLENWQTAGRFELYRLILSEVKQRGGTVEVTIIPKGATSGGAMAADGDLHIVHGGHCSGPGWLSASLAYLPRFWHLNGSGILAESPGKDSTYAPREIDRVAAHEFSRNLRREFAKQRKSRYLQKKEVTAFSTGYIAVVLQGPYPYRKKQSFCSMAEMVKTVVEGAEGRRVVVKPHPVEKEFGLFCTAVLKAEGLEFEITDANIHDLVGSADVIVSVNSSATFEGFMHKKPSILFGRSDFSTLVETVRHPSEFPEALNRATTTGWNFDLMLAWYFKNFTIDLRTDSVLDALVQAAATTGFSVRTLGILG